MKKIAIVTGASSGMGREFARTASREGNFDEIWLIARREERLSELSDELSVPAKVLPFDLTVRENLKKICALLEEEKPDVTLLVNAAGYGKFSATDSSAADENLNMMDLNCGALMALSQICLPYMSEGARIVNFASVASVQPIPYINVYGATKAFVLSFSRALNRELRGRGISVTAVMPFWTATEFFDRAVSEDELIVKNYAAMYRPEQIVKRAWRDAMRRRDVSKFGFIARSQMLLAKILPHRLIMTAWMMQQGLK